MGNNGSVTVETSLVNVAPGLKLEYKGTDTGKGAGDFGFSYAHQHATFAGEVDVLHFAKAKTSVSTGQGAFSAGLSALIGLSKFSFDSLDASVGFKAPKYFGILKANKFFSEFTGLLSFNAANNLLIVILPVLLSAHTNAILIQPLR